MVASLQKVAAMADNKNMCPIPQLVPDPSNVREHDAKNRATIKASLLEHGQVEPLVVQASTMIVVGGNERLSVMKEMGWTEAWCNVMEMTNTQRTRLALILNRSAELAKWKNKPLLEILGALEQDGEDITSLGWEEDDVAFLADKLKDTDVDADADEKDPFANVSDGDASDDVKFRFGDYAGLVSKRVYNSFVETYRRNQKEQGNVMLDDVLREWLGV